MVQKFTWKSEDWAGLFGAITILLAVWGKDFLGLAAILEPERGTISSTMSFPTIGSNNLAAMIGSSSMAWVYLVIAIGLEVSGTTSMKLSNGFSRPIFAMLMVIFYVASFTCLTLALKQLSVSTAYAIWSGMGTALIAIIGLVVFRESFNVAKVLSILMIIAGVVGLNLSDRLH
jgi:small multidrug resistance pump